MANGETVCCCVFVSVPVAGAVAVAVAGAVAVSVSETNCWQLRVLSTASSAPARSLSPARGNYCSAGGKTKNAYETMERIMYTS